MVCRFIQSEKYEMNKLGAEETNILVENQMCYSQ
jgi:hypothetical protein